MWHFPFLSTRGIFFFKNAYWSLEGSLTLQTVSFFRTSAVVFTHGGPRPVRCWGSPVLHIRWFLLSFIFLFFMFFLFFAQAGKFVRRKMVELGVNKNQVTHRLGKWRPQGCPYQRMWKHPGANISCITMDASECRWNTALINDFISNWLSFYIL